MQVRLYVLGEQHRNLRHVDRSVEKTIRKSLLSMADVGCIVLGGYQVEETELQRIF